MVLKTHFGSLRLTPPSSPWAHSARRLSPTSDASGSTYCEDPQSLPTWPRGLGLRLLGPRTNGAHHAQERAVSAAPHLQRIGHDGASEDAHLHENGVTCPHNQRLPLFTVRARPRRLREAGSAAHLEERETPSLGLVSWLGSTCWSRCDSPHRLRRRAGVGGARLRPRRR